MNHRHLLSYTIVVVNLVTEVYFNMPLGEAKHHQLFADVILVLVLLYLSQHPDNLSRTMLQKLMMLLIFKTPE